VTPWGCCERVLVRVFTHGRRMKRPMAEEEGWRQRSVCGVLPSGWDGLDWIGWLLRSGVSMLKSVRIIFCSRGVLCCLKQDR